jgi:hypothetical protein
MKRASGRIGRRNSRAADGFKQRAASGDAVPLLALMIEADDGDATATWRK